jgi:predicted metal-dependent peptidase
LLKPLGGGGTVAGCVSEYLSKNKNNADCVIMFTDGYVEDRVDWRIPTPTLWLVTSNKSFVPPAGGKLVKIEKGY